MFLIIKGNFFLDFCIVFQERMTMPAMISQSSENLCMLEKALLYPNLGQHQTNQIPVNIIK